MNLAVSFAQENRHSVVVLLNRADSDFAPHTYEKTSGP